MNILYLIVPCYNEEAVLPETSKQLKNKMYTLISENKISPKSRILFINDGSKDKTCEIIETLHKENDIFSYINLSRNCGHQNSLLAGLLSVKEIADITISMDADLQQDINAIDLFLDKYENGAEIVYGIRNSRKTDNFFKKSSALIFYKFMKLFGCNVLKNHADYRLMSKRAIQGLSEFNEVNLFLRGIIPLIGYKSDIVYFEVFNRFAGESKYTLKKMVSFAIDGITSLSIKPVRIITATGLLIFVISIFISLFYLCAYFLGQNISGFTTIVMSLWILGGLQLLSLGIVGEYIGKIYLETKSRPRYIIKNFLNNSETDIDATLTERNNGDL